MSTEFSVYEPDPCEPLTHSPDQLSRRHFLEFALAAGLVSSGLVPLANQVITDELWPPDQPQLKTLAYSERLLAKNDYPEGWLTADGLGHQSSRDEAAQFARLALHNAQPMGYFDYANNYLTTESLAPLVSQYARQLGSLSVYGDSLGGPVVLEAARLARVPLRHIVLNCSPFDIDDAWQASEAQLVARLDPHGGFLGEVAYNLLGSSSYDIAKDGEDAIKETIYGIPPSLWTAQLALLTKLDIASNRKDYQQHGIITPDTKVLFCAPQNLQSDGLVNDAAAAQKYRAFFQSFGATFDYVAMPKAGHADTLAAAQYAVRWLPAH
jgi:hypothetical protein